MTLVSSYNVSIPYRCSTVMRYMYTCLYCIFRNGTTAFWIVMRLRSGMEERRASKQSRPPVTPSSSPLSLTYFSPMDGQTVCGETVRNQSRFGTAGRKGRRRLGINSTVSHQGTYRSTKTGVAGTCGAIQSIHTVQGMVAWPGWAPAVGGRRAHACA
ncbi:unnamed protein product [Periconia digitata]|uniref:Uncharacterized protein n=1 Tax=Periconia digitata TaxID=1303443 RepID=A0A9W4UN82_9PLEO|nr:unnamed protein product [Periconia digitata]